MNAFDPDGDTVTYAMSTGPTRGTATVNATTGIYAYTPSASERSLGGLDTFTVICHRQSQQPLDVHGDRPCPSA
jgi:hypothetical protein